MREIAEEMSRKGLGMTCVTEDGCLAGVITDGDLRRQMHLSVNLLERTADDVMSRNPATIAPDTLAAEVLHPLEQRKITSTVVLGDNGQVKGVVHLHDL